MTCGNPAKSGYKNRRLCHKIQLTAVTMMMVRNHPESSSKPRSQVACPKIDWEGVLAQHDQWLRKVVYVRLGEPGAVDDVMQEVSLAAVRQAAPISDPNKVAPWLYRLAVTQSLLYRRKQGRARKLKNSYAERTRPLESDDREQDPLGWLIADERRDRIRQSLERLPSRDSEILTLKYTEGWSYRELAEHLGISQSAVEARLHRARRRMRKELAALEVISDTAKT